MESGSGSCSRRIKAVILVGGPAKGTRFRPLSLELPKPLFPIAGYPIVYHHIEAFAKLSGIKEIILIGFYQPNDAINKLLYNTQQEFKIPIRYLQEFTSLGTAGGIYQFRDQLLAGEPELLFVMNSDVCCDLPLQEMLEFHSKFGPGDRFIMMTTEATRQQSIEFGCVIEDADTHEVLHYVEKPGTFVSTLINCGVYLFTPGIFKFIRIAFLEHQNQKNVDFRAACKESIHLEKEIFRPLAGSGTLFAYTTNRFWSQIKFAGAVIYANRHMLALYERTNPHRLSKMSEPGPVGMWRLNEFEQGKNGEKPSLSINCQTSSVDNNVNGITVEPSSENGNCENGKERNGPYIIGHVFIDPTATVHPDAVIGPNVSIGSRAIIGPGVRLRDCIVLRDAEIRAHACCLSAVIGWNVIVGEWARIEGTPNDPNPNKPFTKLDVVPVFNEKGQLNPSITVIGSDVEVPAECMILNSIVLPHKELTHSFKNQIIL